MSDDKITVELNERKTIRKGLAAVRQDSKVPAVIHNHGKASTHVSGDYMELSKVYARAGKRHPVYLKLGGKSQLAIIKDADFEPVKRRLRHVVFQSIKQDEKVTAEVPIELTGEEIPAEKAGLMVLPQMQAIKIEALPGDLPDKVEADATKLAEVGDRLTVADLRVPSGVTLLAEPDHSIAVVEMPKDQLAEANAAAEALADESAGKPAEEGEEASGEAAKEEPAAEQSSGGETEKKAEK